MEFALDTRKIGSSLLIFGSACIAAVSALILVVLPMTSLSTKVIAAGAAGALMVIGAFLSGNPRLYTIWILMLTIPFDLSKRFGPVVEKMGGETSFRAELSDPFLLILLAFIAWEVATGRRQGIRIPKVTYIWLLIMLQGCIPMVWGPYRTTAAHEVVRMIKVMLLFLVVCNELETAKRIWHCSAALTFSVIVESAVGLYERYRGKLLGLGILGETSAKTLEQLSTESVQGAKVFRISAFLMHPNLFAIFLAALVPLAVAAFFVRNTRGYRMLFLLGFGLGFPALIATLSRSGWVSFAMSFMVMVVILVLHNGMRPRLVLPATFAGVALFAVLLVYWGPIISRLFESKSGATLARQMLNDDAWKLIWEKPWMGWDLNSYAFNVPSVMRINPRKTSKKMWGTLFPVVHNTYLLWWAETGIVGLLLNLWLWGAVIWAGIKNLKVRSEMLFLVNAGCLGGVTAFIPDGFFSFSLRMNAVLRVYWVLAGVILAIQYWRLRHPEGEMQLNGNFEPAANQ